MKITHEFVTHIHDLNRKWWCDLETGEYKPHEREHAGLANLFISEVAELFEALRKNTQSEKIPGHTGAAEELADLVIRVCDTLGGLNLLAEGDEIDLNPYIDRDEIDIAKQYTLQENIQIFYKLCLDHGRYISAHYAANILRYAFVFAEAYQIAVEPALIAKLEYNKTRKDHTIEHRRGENGKKF